MNHLLKYATGRPLPKSQSCKGCNKGFSLRNAIACLNVCISKLKKIGWATEI